MILACQNISKAFGTTEIIKNASFHIEEREKTALVGINGAGKSTLLKIIIGEMRADEGEVILSKGKTMGYLAQHQDLTGHLSIYQEVLTAKVTQVLDGGLSVVVDESRVFIPASLVSDTYEKNLAKYEGQEISFVITEFNPRRGRIIGNRKQLIVAEKAEKQKELFERIHVGDVVEGVVKNVTDFGAFVDLGGADGLLHISEMSWGRIENPKKVFKAGEKIKVLIKDINGDKIALSLKFPEENPWLNAADKYAVGNVVEGCVARMTDFGAFVELEPGVDALLHVSQISREHVEKPSDALKIGQEITAKVVDFNEEDKKISLSMKALENEEPVEE